MQSLAEYIFQAKNESIDLTRDIYKSYTDFAYTDHNLFKIDVDYYLEMYQLNLTESKKIRSNQEKFRDELIKKYNHCVVTDTDPEECDAAHIVPLSESNNYDVDNGLLLTKSLHETFDKYYWCIDPTNPNNLRIVLNKKKLIGKKLTCSKYENKQIALELNDKLLNNLRKRYEEFLKEI
jgi:predicted restriction endonuclease